MRPEEMGKILIVDDDEQIARLLDLRLRKCGYACLLAHTGAQAIGIFQREQVGLIVTDLNMTLGDGFTLIQSIRRRSSVPIVVISGFVREFAERVGQLRDVQIMDKPIDMKLLLSQIHRAGEALNVATL